MRPFYLCPGHTAELAPGSPAFILGDWLGVILLNSTVRLAMPTKMRPEILQLILAYERLIVLAHLNEGALSHDERAFIAFYAEDLKREMLPSRAIQHKRVAA